MSKAHRHKGTARVIPENGTCCPPPTPAALDPASPQAGVGNLFTCPTRGAAGAWGRMDLASSSESVCFPIPHSHALCPHPPTPSSGLFPNMRCEFSPWMTWQLIFTSLLQRAAPEFSALPENAVLQEFLGWGNPCSAKIDKL